MTGRARLVVGFGGLAVLAGVAVLASQAPDATTMAEPIVMPAACSSCDARHAQFAIRRDQLTGDTE